MDPEKGGSEPCKHGIEFHDAVIVFDAIAESPCWTKILRKNAYVTFGMDAQGRVLAVSYALRGNTVRMISARKATSRG